MSCLSFGVRRASGAPLLAFVCLLGACCPAVISTDSLPPGRVGDPYYFEFHEDCWGAFWWVAGELPVGMSFSSEGVLAGVPRYPGIYFLTIGWDDVYEGEVLTSVSKGFDLVIVDVGEPLPEWETPEDMVDEGPEPVARADG